MFGCDSSTVVLASATNLPTNASSVASSALICLTTSFFSKPPAPRSVDRNTRAMPPTAIGRSRTYLPKICGYKNTPNLECTRLALLRQILATSLPASDEELSYAGGSLCGRAQGD